PAASHHSLPLLRAPLTPRPLPSFPTRRSSDLGPLLDRALLAEHVGQQRDRLDVAALPTEVREGDDSHSLLQIFRRDRKRCDIKTDRKSTRLNSSHVAISYAVFCLKNNISGLQ